MSTVGIADGTLCAVCEQRRGTRPMPDGRLFCAHCARTRAELGADRRESLTRIEAWEGFVNWKLARGP